MLAGVNVLVVLCAAWVLLVLADGGWSAMTVTDFGYGGEDFGVTGLCGICEKEAASLTLCKSVEVTDCEFGTCVASTCDGDHPSLSC